MPDVFDQVAQGQPRLKQQLPPSMMTSGSGGTGDVFDEAAKMSASSGTDQEQPGWLDKTIPLDSYAHATESGLQSLGRGARGTWQGITNLVTHPIDTIESLGEIPSQVAQLPDAIHDINQSNDPAGFYAKAAQETAGQGAPQAALAAATEGLGRLAPRAVTAAKPALRTAMKTAMKTASDVVDPNLTGIISPRLASAQRLAGRVARSMSDENEGARLTLAERVKGEPPSNVRTPGQVAPEMVRPRAYYGGKPVEPIPPREGLMLPAPKEQGLTLAERVKGEPPSNVRTPGQVAPEMVRPRAYYGGKPVEPIPPREGLMLPAPKEQGLTLIQKMGGKPVETITGSLPKASGRLVLAPEEAQAEEQIQKIATRRASQRGMQYAAGMKPAGTRGSLRTQIQIPRE
jgi:microcystin-dependent protein